MRGKTRKGLEEQRSGEKGSAALVAVLVVVVLLTLCGAMLSMALRSKDERGSSVDEHQALFAARSGVAQGASPTSSSNVSPGARPLSFTYHQQIQPRSV